MLSKSSNKWSMDCEVFNLQILKNRKNVLGTFQHVTKFIETILRLCIALRKHNDVKTHTTMGFINGVESMLTLVERFGFEKRMESSCAKGIIEMSHEFFLHIGSSMVQKHIICV